MSGYKRSTKRALRRPFAKDLNSYVDTSYLPKLPHADSDDRWTDPDCTDPAI
jgi:hypothetical protein